MKIIVCVKAIPARIEPVQVVENRGLYPLRSYDALINESDEYALDQAILLKGQVGAEVDAITLGLPDSREILFKAYAKGVDRVWRIDDSFLNPERTAVSLAALIGQKNYDLILTGVESSDVMASYVGGRIAAQLGFPFAFAVTNMEVSESKSLIITKEIGGGISKKLEFQLPAVLAIQPGICSLTYPPPGLAVLAKRRPMETIKISDLKVEKELSEVPEWQIQEVYLPEKAGERNIVMLKGSMKDAAARIVDIVNTKMEES